MDGFSTSEVDRIFFSFKLAEGIEISIDVPEMF